MRRSASRRAARIRRGVGAPVGQQAEIVAGHRPGTTTAEAARIKRLEQAPDAESWLPAEPDLSSSDAGT